MYIYIMGDFVCVVNVEADFTDRKFYRRSLEERLWLADSALLWPRFKP
jgi:hypothetical protein